MTKEQKINVNVGLYWELEKIDDLEIKEILNVSYEHIINSPMSYYDTKNIEILNYVYDHKVRVIPIGLLLYKKGEFQKTKRWELVNDQRAKSYCPR